MRKLTLTEQRLLPLITSTKRTALTEQEMSEISGIPIGSVAWAKQALLEKGVVAKSGDVFIIKRRPPADALAKEVST